jgi:hypothetical protein
LPRKVDLGKAKILDSWSVLIENSRGKAEAVYGLTAKLIQDSQAPEIGMERVTVVGRPIGFFKRAQGDYLMVTNEGLKDFRMYVGARDYGNSLNVSWYLTCEPGFFKSFFATLIETNPTAFSFSLDVFQLEDLTAYVTCVHHCLLKAVDKLMTGLGQDPSKIERKSRGFLGVS